jgi:hypothetical protein
MGTALVAAVAGIVGTLAVLGWKLDPSARTRGRRATARREVYERLYIATRELRDALWMWNPPRPGMSAQIEPQAVTAGFAKFWDAGDAVHLFGSSEVRRAVEAIQKAAGSLRGRTGLYNYNLTNAQMLDDPKKTLTEGSDGLLEARDLLTARLEQLAAAIRVEF